MSIRDRMERFAEVMSIALKRDCGLILEGLHHNEVKFGVPICPCIYVEKEPKMSAICPCKDAYLVAEGVRDECHCGLFVKK